MKPRTLALLVLSSALAQLVAGVAVSDPGNAQDAPPVDPEHEALVQSLLDPSKSRDAEVRLHALGPAAVPALVAALRNKTTTDAAIDVLGAMRENAAVAVPGLSAILRQPKHPSHARAIWALGMIGPKASSAVGTLIRNAQDAASPVREVSVRALVRIALADPPAPAKVAAKSDDTAQSIESGCDWLVRHQSPDGSWSPDAFSKQCPRRGCDGPGNNSFQLGLTAIATDALLDPDGPTPAKSSLDSARRAVEWTVARASDDGTIGVRKSLHWMYSHSAALSMLLAADRRGVAPPATRAVAERAVGVVLDAQNPYLAWRYGIRNGDNDTSISSWAIRALDAARAAGIPVGFEAFSSALTWVERMTDPEHGRAGYTTRGGGPARTAELVDMYPHELSEAMTACALDIRLAYRRALRGPGVRYECDAHDAYNEWYIAKGVTQMLSVPPNRKGSPGGVDHYYWWLAAPILRAEAGKRAASWRSSLLRSTVDYQVRSADACDRGSWANCDPWGGEAGRVYTTASAVMALQGLRTELVDRPAPTALAKRVMTALEQIKDLPLATTYLEVLTARLR